MFIHVSKALGEGETTLSAFDEALNKAGIANYNLLCLSSVIPPETAVKVHEGAIPHGTLRGKWGDRLYVVKAEQRTETPGEEVWAGIGWVQDATGQGLFVEHEGNNESSVRDDITKSLEGLMATRGMQFGPINMEIAGGRCDDRPVCAIVVAAYQVSGWDNQAHSNSV